MNSLILTISGMHCDNCVRKISQELESTGGVAQATVDLSTHSATVAHDPGVCRPADLVAAVERAGFRVDGFRPAGASE